MCSFSGMLYWEKLLAKKIRHAIPDATDETDDLSATVSTDASGEAVEVFLGGPFVCR